MSRMEDLLRAATRDSASSVAPGGIPPLDLSDVRWDEGTRTFRKGWELRWRPGIVVPVLAAVLVVAVIALSLALPGLLRAGGAPATPGQVTPPGVPRYYVMASGPQEARGLLRPVDALVVDSQTGAVLATVRPPAGYASFALFGGGAASDRTFVVAAQRYWHPAWDGYYLGNSLQPITFFLLTFDPATGHVTLRKLADLTTPTIWTVDHPAVHTPGGRPVPVPVNEGDVGGFALSPDGTRLAVMIRGWDPDARSNLLTVRVIPLVPGAAARTWQLAGNNVTTSAAIYGLQDLNSLSWSPDGRVLAASYWASAVLIDTTRPSGELLASGKMITLATSPPAGATRGNRLSCQLTGPVLTGGGAELACAATIFRDYPNKGNQPGSPHFNPSTYKNPAMVGTAIATFSAATGHLVSLTGLRPYQASAAGSLGGTGWVSPAGDVVIAYQGNGKATYNLNGSVGPAGRVAIVEIRDGRVERALAEPAWAASSPFFGGWDTYIGW
jgi:hypothetical protein